MFEQAYNAFLENHKERRKGERLRRLEEHGHAEKMFLEKAWWPAFGHFSHLHPEYEVFDFKEGSRFLDFAYIHPPLRVAIEIDGYGPHLRNTTRWQFSDQCRRQNHLTIDGWRIMRFSYDCVKEKPRICQQEIQQLLGRWLGEGDSMVETTVTEKEIIRLAIRLVRPITPGDVAKLLNITNQSARKRLNQLVEKGWLQPAKGTLRIRSYCLARDIRDQKLMML